MSTVARPQLAVREFQARAWVPWIIVLADVCALELSLGLGLLVRRMMASWLTAGIGPMQYLGLAVGVICLPAVHYQLGLYPGYCLGPVERLRRRLLATLAVFGLLIAWDNIVQRGTWSRGILLATLVFALVAPPAAESLVRLWLVRRRRWGIPVLILGAGETGAMIARTLQRDPHLGLVPVAFLDDRSQTWNTFVAGVPVLGPLGLAQDLSGNSGVPRAAAEAAIVSLPDGRPDELAALLRDLSFPRVMVIPNFTGIESMWVTARDLGGCLGLEIKKNLLLRRNLVLKRMMDQAIGLPLFLASLPVMALAAAAIKLISPGPAFYRQRREGLYGRRLSVWKLRTMRLNADEALHRYLDQHPAAREHWLRHFKLRHDPRILPLVGTLLRRTSLDELPQLWSVLRGEMSLVGPRPVPDYHLEQFPPEFRSLRTRVLPGLTGLWQVTTRSNGDVRVQEALDTYYIRNWSPWLDLYLLARTVAAVLTARGAY